MSALSGIKSLLVEESGYGSISKKIAIVIGIIALVFCIYQVLSSRFYFLPSQLHRLLHWCFAAVLVFLVYPLDKKRSWKTPVDIVLIILSIAACAYFFINNTEITEGGRMGAPNSTDTLFGIVVIAVVLEMARRTVGNLLSVVALIFMLYAYLGSYIPGLLGHKGFDIYRIVGTMYMGQTGIFGIPIGVSSTFVFLFVLFGVLMQKTGGGTFFSDAAYSVAGRMRSGPAQTAVIGSALMGTISGSAVANVVTTGNFTIPLMKKMGYHPNYAGAVEATSSTGGQFMPPIMGTTAFLIAEFLSISYAEVALAALIPALLYYFCLGTAVHFESGRLNMQATPKNQLPVLGKVMKEGGVFILPLVVLIILILNGYSIMACGQIAVVLVMLAAAIKTIMELKKGNSFSRLGVAFIESFKSASKTMLSVISACACAGIIIGSVGLTGLGTKISSVVMDFSGGSLFLSLVLCAIASLILGMGLVAVAAYVLLAILVAPALIDLGVMPLAAHLFIFYFGMLSFVTPPVAVAAYAAAGISEGDPVKTGFIAFRLAIVGFVIPFLIIYNPCLLMKGSIITIAGAVVSALIGCVFIAAGFTGFFRDKCGVVQRILMAAAGFCLLTPGYVTDGIGLAILLVSLATSPKSWGISKKEGKGEAESTEHSLTR